MADAAGRTVIRARRPRTVDAFGSPRAHARHPLVAEAVLLLVVLLTIVFGGWEVVGTQASSVGGMLGR